MQPQRALGLTHDRNGTCSYYGRWRFGTSSLGCESGSVMMSQGADSGESWASSPAVRKSMRGNRSRDTRPEIAVRRAVHGAGLRFRVSRRPIAGLNRTGDLVFGPSLVAVFIDGCFWHGCPDHYAAPKTNSSYLAVKVAANRTRDRSTDARLLTAGWLPLRFWEHEDPTQVAAVIVAVVKSRRPTLNRNPIGA